MLTVEDYGKILLAHRDGMSIRQIARRFGYLRRKVRQVLEDSEPHPYTLQRDRAAPRLGPFKMLIEQILAEDQQAPRKQQHTAPISSHPGHCAQRLGTVIRNHWSVDVAFHEDSSRIRVAHAAENFSRLRRIALMLLKQDKTIKNGLAAKRLRARWDRDYLIKVLGI